VSTTWAWEHLEPAAAARMLHERDPRGFEWGVYVLNDSTGAQGGGFGAFFWFEDPSEMGVFLTDVATPVFGGDGWMAEDWRGRAVHIMRRAIEGKVGWERARNQVNALSRHAWQIEWWGPYDELRSAECHPFVLRVVHQFRGFPEISEQEEPRFLDWLKTFDGGYEPPGEEYTDLPLPSANRAPRTGGAIAVSESLDEGADQEP
jgi:hypothetical protein